jgi:hypothetical protein
MSWQSTYDYIMTNITTNGVRSISGAKMQTALNMILSVIEGESRAGVESVISTASNIITFKNRTGSANPFPALTVYSLDIDCYDDDGNTVDHQLIASDLDGFTVVVAEDCTVNYIAKEMYQTIPD